MLMIDSAYEISTHWKKDPPPKEILEDITAKGGGVMNRTLENFEKPESREAKRLTNGRSTESPEPEQTPKQDKMDVDDPNSANGRSTRGKRCYLFFDPPHKLPAAASRDNIFNKHVVQDSFSRYRTSSSTSPARSLSTRGHHETNTKRQQPSHFAQPRCFGHEQRSKRIILYKWLPEHNFGQL